ncbi:MAG: hypothetical protein RMX97_25045 [Nostoc sp. DedQUE11]|nr:hypothetical protein [Nostoc sp. DedQUE11]
MMPAAIAIPSKELPLLFEGLTWREFKAVEQLLDRPGYRLSFLDGVLEIRRMSGEPHETIKKRIAALLEPSSEEVKGIDLDLLLRCINMVNHVDAIKTFQQALQK